ncbi:MAG TPA: hypothetical protein VMZ31_10830 [Phycisphaerae bacterium]|nr:hypothetical protein [Phycisphaerae bacterium]
MLEPADGGLLVTLTRDLSHKYNLFPPGNDGADPDQEQAEPLPPLDLKRGWCVAGTWDLLEVTKFDALDEIADRPLPASWAESRNLVLFPFREHPLLQDFVPALLNPQEIQTDSQHPLLVLTMISLSPPAYEFDDDGVSVVRAIGNLVNLLKEAQLRKVDRPETAYLGSLSTPDLVLISLPKNPAQLHGAHVIARLANRIRLDEIRRGDFLDSRKSSVADEQWPGHACVVATPMLAFRLKSKSYFSTDEYRNAEERYGVSFPFRLRVDCGHAQQVVEDTQQVCSDVVFTDGREGSPRGKAPTAWDAYTLRGRFDHLYDLAHVLQKKWQKRKWRQCNLVDSITTVLMDDVEPTWEHDYPPWTITEEIVTELSKIRDRLDRFSRRFLNQTQARELEGAYRDFRSFFFRQDLLGTARDLFPFFRQLSLAFKEVTSWERYLHATDHAGMDRYRLQSNRCLDFRYDLSTLIPHVARALRNRIEHRALDSDPPFPQTLRYGTCKLLSAYTVVAYMASQLLRQEATAPPGEAGAGNAFASCVAAGFHGRVTCDEAFSEFREYLERHENILLSTRPTNKWSARLLLLDISGKSLLRPEIALVHYLHEIAEREEWILQSRCTKLRKELNSFVLHHAAVAFFNGLQRALYPARETLTRTEEKPLLRDAFSLVTFVVLRQLLGAGMTPTGEELRRYGKELLQSAHPQILAEDVCHALGDAAQDSGTIAEFSSLYKNIRQPDSHPKFESVLPDELARDGFHLSVATIRELVPEIVADIGLWCALHHLLTAGGTQLDHTLRLANLGKVFQSVLVAGAEADPGGNLSERLRESILFRYSIQAAAADRTGVDWEDSVISNIEGMTVPVCKRSQVLQSLRNIKKFRSLFDPDRGLITRLRAFNAYGGERQPLVGDGSGTLENSLFAIFHSAWSKNPPATADRLKLAFNLWAVSTRLCLPKMFVPVERDQAGQEEPVPVG